MGLEPSAGQPRHPFSPRELAELRERWRDYLRSPDGQTLTRLVTPPTDESGRLPMPPPLSGVSHHRAAATVRPADFAEAALENEIIAIFEGPGEPTIGPGERGYTKILSASYGPEAFLRVICDGECMQLIHTSPAGERPMTQLQIEALAERCQVAITTNPHGPVAVFIGDYPKIRAAFKM